ncbi:MAG: hypothetical protein BWY79_02112 [Actinobacteria bacterium ADurb.Bin444]|nr:MAG: hypothetical protein BWY79_02112 [Actinobacteria bacterium ADurb.Bin444]
MERNTPVSSGESSAGASRGFKRMSDRATTEAMKVRASSPSAAPIPTLPGTEPEAAFASSRAMSSPAKVGPTNMANCAVPWITAFPTWRPSRPTSRGTIAPCAGKKKASAKPNKRAKT